MGMKLKEQLKGIISEEELKALSNRFHVIGDIAVLSLHPDLEVYGNEIAKTIISKHRNIKTVLNKVSKLNGENRVAGLETLAGDKTITLHREYGFAFRLDVSKVFFNSHLSYERMRVAQSAKPRERVLVPFSGVGPFAIPIAARGSRVTALEKNSDACHWLAENARMNGVEENIDIIKGDALDIANLLNLKRLRVERAVIPTPYGMDHILETISLFVKQGGTINFYTFKKKSQIDDLIENYKDMGFEVEFYRRCGNVAPGVSRWVFDLVKA